MQNKKKIKNKNKNNQNKNIDVCNTTTLPTNAMDGQTKRRTNKNDKRRNN